MIPLIPTHSRDSDRRATLAGLCPVLLMLLAVFMVSAASAQDQPTVTTAYWIDDGGRADLSEVAARFRDGGFEAFDQALAEGYIPHPIWVAVTLDSGVAEDSDWVIRIRPPWHDRIEFFGSPSGAGMPISVLGSKVHSPTTIANPLSYDFYISQKDIEQTVFFKVSTVHSFLFDVQVLTQAQVSRSDRNNALFFGFYFSFLCAALLWSLITWLGDRERVLGAFCAQLFLSIAYAACMFGLTRMFLPDEVPSSYIDAWTNLLIIAYPMSVIWFYRELYSDYGLRVWARRGLDAIVALGGVCLTIMLLGEIQEALRLNALILTASAFWLLACPWIFLNRSRAKLHPEISVWLMRAVVTLLLGLAFVGVVGTLGVASEEGVAINGFLLHAFALAVLMTVALQYRAQKRNRDLTNSEARALQRMEDELRYREQLQRFMNMFSHEVRTPLAVANIAIEQGINDPELLKKGTRAVSDIDALVARCLEADQMESGALPVSKERLFVRETLEEIAASHAPAATILWCGDYGIEVLADRWISALIFANLVENAMKYGLTHFPIEVAIEHGSEQGVTVCVSNAIDERGLFDQDQVFNKFYRSDHAKRKSGAGLGLYLARALAEMQEGTLDCSISEENKVMFTWTMRQ